MSSILHFIKAGGFVMYPLLLLSLVAIVVIVERGLAYRQFGGVAPGLLGEVLKQCRNGQYEAALKACQGRPGPVAACLTVVLQHRNQPTREVERLVEETGQDYFIRLERLLPVLDTTTTVSPLLGLLGTIVGMIGTFSAIASQANRSNSDAVLAGVGEALYATATGILIAVICFVAYNYFAARLRTITSETEQAATKLINALSERHHQERAQTNHAGMDINIEEANVVEFKRRRELKRTKIEIIPMIDTMFFLLVFFMLSSLALVKLNGLPVNLPRASTAPKQPASDLTITVDANRQVYVNKEPVTFDTLTTVLAEKAGGPNVDLANASVVINADLTVPHGIVVKCIDESRSIGITKFAIATSPENGAK